MRTRKSASICGRACWTARDKAERFDAEIQLHTGHLAGMQSTQYLCGRKWRWLRGRALFARSPVHGMEGLANVPLLKARPAWLRVGRMEGRHGAFLARAGRHGARI